MALEPTATNPQTGERIVLRNGQWVPAGGAAPAPQQYPGRIPGLPEQPEPYKPPAGYAGGPDRLNPIPGGPADPNAPQNQPKDGGKPSATELELGAKAEGTRRRAETIRRAMAEVAGLYESDIKGQPASRLFGATEYIDTLPKNDRFRAAGNAILPLIRPLVAQTAKEGDSDKEMQVFMAYVPSNDDSDIAIEQKFKMLDALISGMAEGKPPSAVLQDNNAAGAEEVTRALEGGKSRDEILAIAAARGVSVDEAALDANLASRQSGGPVNKAVPGDIAEIMAKYGVQ